MLNKKKILLRQRWEDKPARLQLIVEALQNGEDWTVYLKCHPTIHEFDDLLYVNDLLANKKGKSYAPMDLRGVKISNIDIKPKTILSGINFDYSIIDNIDFTSCILNGTSFENAKLSNINFNNCKINNTSYAGSIIEDVNFNNAIMSIIDFSFSNISFASLLNCELRQIKISSESSLGFVFRIIGYKQSTVIRKFKHDISKINENKCDGEFLKFLNEEYKLSDLEKDSKIFSWLFYLFTNHGRSFSRLSLWIITIWLGFGFLYASYPIPKFISNPFIQKFLFALSPEINWTGKTPAPYYFSCTTLVTLTYGDIIPVDFNARMFCATEAILGYIFLGMFISMIFHIFSKK
ncbi:MAG: pentapeptide repeat-containing protein [Candidatus Woesearchaeota archaeon]|jgi:hypothetical protein